MTRLDLFAPPDSLGSFESRPHIRTVARTSRRRPVTKAMQLVLTFVYDQPGRLRQQMVDAITGRMPGYDRRVHGWRVRRDLENATIRCHRAGLIDITRNGCGWMKLWPKNAEVGSDVATAVEVHLDIATRFLLWANEVGR